MRPSLRAVELGQLELQLRRQPAVWIVTGLPGIGTTTFLRELAGAGSHTRVLSLPALSRPLPRGVGRVIVDGVEAIDRGSLDRIASLVARGVSVIVGASRPLALPDAGTLVLTGLSEVSALALFEARRAGRRVAAELPALRRVDGHPAAIVRLAEQRIALLDAELDELLEPILSAPPSLLARLDDHLRALPPALLHVARVLAALPGPFDLPIAAGALEQPPAEVFASIDALTRWGVIVSREHGAGLTRLAVHALCRLRLSPPTHAPRGHHDVILARAERLGALGPRTAHEARMLAADLPYLEPLAARGQPSAAVAIDHHLRASASFRVRAARLARSELPLGSPAPEHVALALAQAEIALGLGELDAARAALDTLAPADDERASLVHLRRGHAWLRAASAGAGAAAQQRGLDEMARAVERARGSRAAPHVLAEAAYHALHVGSPPHHAREQLERAIALASIPDAAGQLDELALARAYGFDALLALHVGDLARAEASSRSARAVAAELGDLRDERLAAMAHALASAELDRPGEAAVGFARAIHLAEQSGAQRAAAEYAGHAGAHALARGDLAEAKIALHRAVTELERAGDLRSTLLFEPCLVLARRLSGERCDDPRDDLAAEERDPPERTARRLLHLLAVAAVGGRPALARALDRFLAEEATARAPVVLGAELRLALRLGRTLAAGSTDGVAAIERTAPARYALPDGRTLDLEEQPVLARLFDFLVERARAAPGVAVSAEAMLAAGWPDERTVARSGAQRVHTAVRRLRRAGLDTLLRSSRDGYWLDARVLAARSP